jgi:outer membrane protein assembly factor BamE (lipoprotein component of BamABCDE complex)
MSILKKVVILFLCAPLFALGQSSGNMTLGQIQQAVVKGATKDQIVEKLGSPNMVTSSKENSETWIYDKVSSTTETKAEESSASTSVGGVVGILGIVGIGGKSDASKSEAGNRVVSSQKTLTLIIKFKGDRVESFATRMSSF